MLTILLGRDWKINNDTVLRMIAQKVRNREGNTVLLVPELVSHQMERALVQTAGDTSCRYAEVLSFSRLAKRVAEYCNITVADCLDNGGRVVAMAAATRSLHSVLKAYAAVETKPEFLVGLLDAVDEFKRCCVSAEDLMAASKQTEGSLAQKLEELSLILQTYNAICEKGKRDPRDQMTWLLDRLEDSDFAENHTVYFDFFPAYSKQHFDILCHFIRYSPNTVVSLHCDEPNSEKMAYALSGTTASDIISYALQNNIPYRIEMADVPDSPNQTVADSLLQGKLSPNSASGYLYTIRTDSLTDCCRDITERVTHLVQNGARYRDISIVFTDAQSHQGTIENVLNRAGIPAYFSGTEDILEKSAIHTLLTALDASLGGFSTVDVLRYLKSMLSPVGEDICDRIENYAIIWSIDGNGWTVPWTKHPRGLEDVWSDSDRRLLEQINTAKEKAVKPLLRLRDGFRSAANVQQQIVVLYDFLEDIKLHSRLEALSRQLDESGENRDGQILSQLWEILIGALEQIYDILTDTSWESETFTRLLKLLLSQYDVGTIPAVLDAVTVGSISAMRCQRCKYLFIVGASEGMFPTYGASAGVFNDQERQLLQKLGVTLNAGAIDGLQTQFAEIQDVFCSASNQIYVYCTDGQPSFIYSRLALLSGEDAHTKPLWGTALSDPWEAAAFVAVHGNAEDAAELCIEREYNGVRNGVDYTLGTMSPESVQALYGSELNLSASQVDRLAECRLSYFLRYGLRASERKQIKIDPAEFGEYVHAVLENCGRTIAEKGGFKNVSLEETLKMAASYSEKYFSEHFKQLDSDRVAFHFKRNAQELQAIVKELWEEMSNSSFEAFDFELSFGKTGKMPAIAIHTEEMDANLRGFVDRVDLWRNGDNTYVRVVDYKTGKKDFDYCDVFNGIGLQMLLYLFALEDGGAELIGQKPLIAGVSYFPARVPYISAEGTLSAEEAELAHSKELKRKGLILSDEHVLQAMEDSDPPKRLPIKKSKDGTVSGYVASSAQFKSLKKYVFNILRSMVKDIASGNITPNPYTRGSSHNACRFCPYDAICHSEQVADRRNYRTITSDEFWDGISKEVEKNG